jgi:hypothetical protein
MAVHFSLKRTVLALLLTVIVTTCNAFVLSKRDPPFRTSNAVIPKPENNVFGQRIRVVPSSQGWAPTDKGAPLWVGRFSDSNNNNNNNNEGGNYDFWSRNKARTDVRSFLTQRSIQSFVYLLNQCREEHSVRWLEVSFVELCWTIRCL